MQLFLPTIFSSWSTISYISKSSESNIYNLKMLDFYGHNFDSNSRLKFENKTFDKKSLDGWVNIIVYIPERDRGKERFYFFSVMLVIPIRLVSYWNIYKYGSQQEL